jgi:hypothetical protein
MDVGDGTYSVGRSEQSPTELDDTEVENETQEQACSENFVFKGPNEGTLGGELIRVHHVENLEQDYQVEAVGQVNASVVIIIVVALISPARTN